MLQKCLSLHANWKKFFFITKLSQTWEPRLLDIVNSWSRLKQSELFTKSFKFTNFFFVEDTISISDRIFIFIKQFFSFITGVSAFEAGAKCNIL